MYKEEVKEMKQSTRNTLERIKRHLPGTTGYDGWREKFIRTFGIIEESGVDNMRNYNRILRKTGLDAENWKMEKADIVSRNALRRGRLEVLVHKELIRNPAILGDLLRDGLDRGDANITVLDISDKKLLALIAMVYMKNRQEIGRLIRKAIMARTGEVVQEIVMAKAA